jgi:hypothetical protein
MKSRVTPYTTRSGLQIGCRYEAPRRIETLSRDASRLQSALLSGGGPVPLWVRLLWRWL